MGQSFYQQTQLWFKAFEARCGQLEQRIGGLNHVLQEIIGKELMRGQALHKLLMDKGLFTDEELKKALEDLIAEAKADLAKAEQEVKQEKDKAIEILIPAGANVSPPAASETSSLAPGAPVTSKPIEPMEIKNEVSSVPTETDASSLPPAQ
jgi:polyhydroxyalkanoate synthesis regulator phasin